MYQQKGKRKKESEDDDSNLDQRTSIRTLNLDVLIPTNVCELSPNLAIGPLTGNLEALIKILTA